MMQEFVQQAKNLMSDMIGQIHTAIPGTISSFDPASCQATVQPIGKFKKPDGSTMDFPAVSGVPVVLIQSSGQQATVAYPVKSGDGCLLVFSEQALDSWMSGGDQKSELRFDLTNCMAIPGLFVSGNPVIQEACSQNAIIIDKNGKRITVSNQNVAIRGDVSIEGNLTITGKIEASGDVTAGPTSLQNHVHSGVDSGPSNTGKPV